MSFGSVKDNEANKFRGTPNLPKIAVTVEDGILSGINYDELIATYPTSTTEVYLYNLLGVLQASPSYLSRYGKEYFIISKKDLECLINGILLPEF
jgi:hypothetical protein